MILEDWIMGISTFVGVIALGMGMDWLTVLKNRRRDGDLDRK